MNDLNLACDTAKKAFDDAIDALDGIMQSIHRPDLWKKYKFTEEKLREKKEPMIREFSETLNLFNKLVEYAKTKGLF